jgi:hypothetical protein
LQHPSQVQAPHSSMQHTNKIQATKHQPYIAILKKIVKRGGKKKKKTWISEIIILRK